MNDMVPRPRPSWFFKVPGDAWRSEDAGICGPGVPADHLVVDFMKKHNLGLGKKVDGR